MRTSRWTIPILAAAVLLPAAAGAQTATVDTTFAAPSDGRLELHNQMGSVRVVAWNQARVRVIARRSTAVPVEIERSGVVVSVQAPRQMQRGARIDYEVTVPAGMDLELHGMNSPMSVDGSNGAIEIHTINGDVDVRGGRDRIEIATVNGSVQLQGARGRVEVTTVNEAVTLRDVSGDGIVVNGVNGSVRLEDVDARAVEATTVSGEIRYRGTLRPGGTYELSSHNSSIVMFVPSGASARFQVETYNGTLHTRFPVTLQEGAHGKRFEFTLGSGEARVSLTSFNGTIDLRRPGS